MNLIPFAFEKHSYRYNRPEMRDPFGTKRAEKLKYEFTGVGAKFLLILFLAGFFLNFPFFNVVHLKA
jgi:hypothetical protein